MNDPISYERWNPLCALHLISFHLFWDLAQEVMFLLLLTFAIILSFQTCFWVSYYLKQKTNKQMINHIFPWTHLSVMSFIVRILKKAVYICCLHHLIPYSLLFDFCSISSITISCWDYCELYAVKLLIIFSHQNTSSLVDMYDFLSWNFTFLGFFDTTLSWFCSYLSGHSFKKYFCLKLCLI